MFTTAAVISLAVALLRGGKFQRLADAKVDKVWLLFAAFVIQFGPGWLERFGVVDVGPWGPAIHVLSYVPLTVMLLANLRLVGAPVIIAGMVLNVIPIAANGGRMPVSGAAMARIGLAELIPTIAPGMSYDHVIIDSSTRFGFLGDIIPQPWPPNLANVFSIGDLVLGVGLFLIIQQLMGAGRYRTS
ncbi:MAG: DUF5317 domain-containing protein [Chloroflexota bacterium]